MHLVTVHQHYDRSSVVDPVDKMIGSNVITSNTGDAIFLCNFAKVRRIVKR